jgi:Ni/Co efflux regulator RcnB
MKTIFASAIALSLLTGSAFAAQPAHPGQPQAQSHNQAQVHNQGQKPQHQTGVKTVKHVEHAKGEYRYNGKTYKAVKAPVWHAPRGYDARQSWHRGQALPAVFRDRAYVVDYRAYHLDRPAAGYQWVRVNNNVYLVQANSGLIAQIVWSMFY